MKEKITLILKDYYDNEKTEEHYLDIDIDDENMRKLAKALKPYLDSIQNCECKGCKR